MSHEVIMPALGMAQSTGRLLRWLRPSGSQIKAGDALFEVETDKTTMEVEAQVDGFLTAVTAYEGQDVPVGQVIAVIAAQADAASFRPVPEPPAPEPGDTAPPVASAPAATPITPMRQPPEPVAGRILASPKARRMAAAEGLDLTVLVRAGYPQPYHAADIARLRDLATTAPLAPSAQSLLHVAARTPRDGSDAFLARMRDEAGITLERHALWLAFAAAAWRAVRPGEGALVVERQHPGNPHSRWLDPDRARLSAQPSAGDAAAELILRDLTGTCLTAFRADPAAVPVLTFADDGDTLRLSFDADIAALSPEAAQDFLTDLARRLADPLLFLV